MQATTTINCSLNICSTNTKSNSCSNKHNHPSGSCDLSYFNNSNCDLDCDSYIDSLKFCIICRCLMIHHNNLTNYCLKCLKLINIDKSIQMDYQIKNKSVNNVNKIDDDHINDYQVNKYVNNLIKAKYVNNLLNYFMLIILLASSINSVNCNQRTYVQLMFETEENLPVNSLIGQIKLPDSLNNNFTQSPYLILPVNIHQKSQSSKCNLEYDLNIDQHTGSISNAVSLDHEKCSLYKFLAISLKGLSFQITIKILDKNDNKPYFNMQSINLQILENSKPNETRIQLPRAIDHDDTIYGLKEYRIKSGNLKNSFKLFIHRENDDQLYADLVVNNELDREEIDNFRLIIEALDGDQPPLTAELEVLIEILDVNEKPYFEKSIYNVKLQQNATIGSKIIQCQATDNDIGKNAQINYSLQESPNTLKLLNKNQLINHLFKIDNNGWITLENSLFDLPKNLKTIELIVIARDSGDISLEANSLVVIKIQNLNNFNLPKINIQLLNYNNQPELNESTSVGEIIARITVTDDDEEQLINKQINYKLILDDQTSIPKLIKNKFRLNEINSNTYLLIVNDKLDREQQEYFNLKFTAYQSNNPSLNSTKQLQLKLIDSNNHKPYFENKNNQIKLNQNLDIGTIVYQFKALDSDLPSTNRFTYNLDILKSSKESLEWFELNKTTGELKIKQFMDCNLNKKPMVVVNVNDGLNESEESSLILELQSDNNNVPQFEKIFYNVTVDENADIGFCLARLKAIDLDCGKNSSIEYSFLATSRADLPLTNELSSFYLNKTTGELCLKSSLDYEKRNFYELIVNAYNNNDNQNGYLLNSTSIVHIYVTDINDHQPFFKNNFYKVNVHENIVPLMNNGLPAPILIIKAYDEDLSSAFNTIHYSILNGNNNDDFEIDEQSGKLYLLRPLSSVRSNYQLTISAQDLQGLKSDKTATVQVNVLNSGFQQQYLHFTSNLYNFNLVENALPGSKIGKLNVQTTTSPLFNHHVNMYNINQTSSQPSNHLLEYEIYSGDENHYFKLDQNTGELTVNRNISQLLLNSYLDYETRQNLLLNVQCRLINNNEYIYAYSQINISIQDLNDLVPEFYNDLIIVSLKENLKTSKSIFQVKAIDLDTGLFGRIKYHFRTLIQENYETSDHSGPFKLDKLTGEIYLNGELDFEKQTNYDLNLIAIDGGGRTSETQLKIKIIDVCDNSPIFIDQHNKQIHQLNLSVYENLNLNELIYKFKSFDIDVNDKTLKYSVINEKQLLVNQSIIESNSSDCFKIGLITGELKVNCVLDAENVLNYKLKLQIKDSGNNSGYLNVFIKLLDVNDNIPQFKQKEYRFEISEDSPVNTKIGTITGYDLDSEGLNSTINFKLIKNFDDFFKLNSTTGELFLNHKIDRECDKDRYILKVQISDLGDKIKLVNDQPAIVIINILNINDNKPVFLDQNMTISNFIKLQCSNSYKNNMEFKIENFKISTNSKPSITVTKIRAYDMDLDQIEYSFKFIQKLTNQNQFQDTLDNPFTINSDGLIQTKTNFQDSQKFRLAIQIKDSNGLIGDHLKWIEIEIVANDNSKMNNRKLNNHDIEYIELDTDQIDIGSPIGSIIDVKKLINQTSNCDNFYLTSQFDDINQPFILNINQTKINLISLTKFNTSFYLKNLNLYSNLEDCSLSLTTKFPIKNKYQKLLTFEIEIKNKLINEKVFDCFRKQLINSEFGNELMQISLDFNQEFSYEKSIDLFDFKNCSTIESNQKLKLIAVDKSIKLFNQLKLNSDLVLQLWPDNELPYDKEILIRIESSSDFNENQKDAFLINFIFNKPNDLNLNNLKVISQDKLEFKENCCLKNENIHQILLNYDLHSNNKYDIKFTIKNGYNQFKIDNNGLISLLNEFDYEKQINYDLNILIEISELINYEFKLVKQLEHLIKIEIDDINDEFPKFNQTEFNIEISENTAINSILIKLNATDLDNLDNLIYLIPDGYQFKKKFELSKTGELILKNSLIGEKISNYKIPIIVFDNDYQHNTQTFINLSIIFNNNKPIFKQSENNLLIPENLPINTLLYTFIAIDDEANQLVYELINCQNYDNNNQININQIKSSTCNNQFKLDTKSGQLYTNNEIDYEKSSFYNLTVSVTDGQYSSTTNLLIKIKNLNDNIPQFDKDLYELSIDIDTMDKNLEFIQLTTIEAFDLDKNSKLYYSIDLDLDDGMYYTLNSTTGQLSIHKEVLNQLLKKKLSINKQTIIKSELEIQVINPTEYNVFKSSTRIKIKFSGMKLINNLINELDELSKERIRFSEYPLVFELNDKLLNKKLIKSDRPIKFRLINQTDEFRNQFSLNENGYLQLKQPLKNQNYECYISARLDDVETVNLIQFTRIPLIEQDIDRKVRKFNFELNLEENLEIGYQLIELKERVNIYLKNEHHFNIIYSSVNSSWFNLNSKTGLLKTAISFDYEKHPSKIELVILANIQNSYLNIMFFNLTINLINLNEFNPIFNHPTIYTTINESLSKDTFVVKLSSIDLDTINNRNNSNNRLDFGTTYHIVEGDKDNAFYIKDNSIYTKSILDREICEKYTLFIYINDQTTIQNQRTSIKSKSNSIKYLIVEIFIIDIDDNTPFIVSNQEFTIIDNQSSQLVGQLNTNDVDLYPMLTYKLLNNYDNLFDLNQFNGEIRLKKRIKYRENFENLTSIDYDSSLKEFYLNVIVNDSKHQAQTQIKISLKRPNIYQQMPIFNQEIYYYEMNNKDCLTTINCVLFQLNSLPFKRNLNQPKIKAQYKLLGKANRYFFIDSNDGYIYNNQSFNDFNKNRLFRIVVQSYYAFENGRPINNLKSTTTLFIVIRKINDQFKNLNQTIESTIELEKYKYGDIIYKLPSAKLIDSKYFDIQYQLMDTSIFNLKNKNQLIILKKPKRIENRLKIKRIIHNQFDFIELNIRNQLVQDNQIFKRKLFNVQIEEDSSIGDKIIDLKGNENSSNFTIYKGNQLNQFSLDHSSGSLYLSKFLNCKLVNHFNLIILGCNDLKCSFTIVNIQIKFRKHLTLPILPLNNYQAIIQENIPIGTKIIRLLQNNTLSNEYKFVLINKNNQDQLIKLPFEFDSKTGYLITSSLVDYEQLFYKNSINSVLDLKFGIQLTPLSIKSAFHNGSSSLIRLNENNILNLLNEVSIKIKVNSKNEFHPKSIVKSPQLDQINRNSDFVRLNTMNIISNVNMNTNLNANMNINSNANMNKIQTKNILPTSNYEPNEFIDLKSSIKQSPNLIRNFNNENNFSLNSQRKLNLPNYLIQVYGLVIGLLSLLLILVLFSVILLFRICNFNHKTTPSSTSSNNSIYNSKNQNFDTNSQLTKSLNCLIDRNYNSNYNKNYNSNFQNHLLNQNEPTVIINKQHKKLKQTDFLATMALRKDSIIYQNNDQNKNQSISNSSLITTLTNQNDTSSSCNTTIIHSHQNSESKSSTSECSTISINSKITRLNDNQFNNKNHVKNRPLPTINQPDLVNNYDEVRENNISYYNNYKFLNQNLENHNYEAITYDHQIDISKNWNPVYPVNETQFALNSMIKNKSTTNQFLNEQSKRNQIKIATLSNTNKLN